MNEPNERLVVTLVKALAALAPIAIVLYVSEPSVRWMIDQQLAQLRYRLQLVGWRRRVWDRWSGWQREVYEQRHGRPDA